MRHGHEFDMALFKERSREIKARQERLAAKKKIEAAAPDLLQISKDIVAFDKNDQFSNNYLVHILVKKAKAAIAKCS